NLTNQYSKINICKRDVPATLIVYYCQAKYAIRDRNVTGVQTCALPILYIKILDLLQKKTQLSNAELSKIVNLSPPATHARLKRLEQRGYIDKYIAVLNKEKLNFDL